MKIPLQNFEAYIDEKILARGLNYYQNKQVGEPESLRNNTYTAEVYGTETYDVTLKIDKDELTESVCNCPYDLGPICKHIVAVLFELQGDKIDVEVMAKKPKKKRAKSKKAQLDEVFKKASQKDLSSYLRDVLDNDKDLRNHFLSSFAHLQENANTRTYYDRRIKDILKSIAGRDGFIGWGNTHRVWNGVAPLVDLSKNSLANGNYINALHISTSLLVNLVDAINYTDDSNGDLGSIIDDVTDDLYEIAHQDLNDEAHNYFFNFCLTEVKNETFKGWDWHTLLVEMAAKLAKDVGEYDMITVLMQKMARSKYDKDRIEEIQLILADKFKSKEEYEKMRYALRHNSKIRIELIQESIDADKLDQAREYALEGQEYDKEESPGLVDDWINWELKIAQLAGDDLSIIRLSRMLLLHNWRNEQDYFGILKDKISDTEWIDYRSQLIKEMQKSKSWESFNLIQSIYVREAMYDDLLAIVKLNPDLSIIESNEKYLVKDHASVLSELYANAILKYLDFNKGRKHYKKMVKYIRKIKKIDSIKKSKELINELRVLYPRRRALMEELDKV